MIFGEIDHPGHYSELHAELSAFVRDHFSRVQSGLQGDSWIWILDGEEKVAIDTFTSMKHQVKSPKPGPHVRAVMDVLARRFHVTLFEKPALEGHEDGS